MAHLLLKTMSLTTVDLSANDISSKGIGLILKAMLFNRSVRSLDLSSKTSSSRNRFSRFTAGPLEDLLEKNSSLQRLSLSACTLGVPGAQGLGRGLVANHSLLYLDWARRDEGFISLACSLGSLPNKADGSHPVWSRAMKSSEAAAKYTDGLNILRTTVAQAPAQELFEVPIGLTQKKTPVEQIQERLSRATAHRPRALTADLRETNPHVRPQEAAQVLHMAVKAAEVALPKLKTLNLSKNQPTAIGTRAVADALHVNDVMERLQLDRCDHRDPDHGYEGLIGYLPVNTTLRPARGRDTDLVTCFRDGLRSPRKQQLGCDALPYGWILGGTSSFLWPLLDLLASYYRDEPCRKSERLNLREGDFCKDLLVLVLAVPTVLAFLAWQVYTELIFMHSGHETWGGLLFAAAALITFVAARKVYHLGNRRFEDLALAAQPETTADLADENGTGESALPPVEHVAVRARHLGLSHAVLGAEGLTNLAKCMVVNQALRSLNLSGNLMDEAVAAAWGVAIGLALGARGLAQNEGLESLSLRDNALRDAAAEALEEALLQNGSVVQLNLELNSMDLRFLMKIKQLLERNDQIREKSLPDRYRSRIVELTECQKEVTKMSNILARNRQKKKVALWKQAAEVQKLKDEKEADRQRQATVEDQLHELLKTQQAVEEDGGDTRNPLCWEDGLFSYDMCCGEGAHNVLGNPSCWEGPRSFQTCCLPSLHEPSCWSDARRFLSPLAWTWRAPRGEMGGQQRWWGGLFDGEEEEVPLCVFYDLDLFDAHLATLKEAFGSTVQHRMAIKACPLSRLMRYAYERWGFGVECASMGEVKLALEHCQIPASMLVFDSPAKTRKELQFALDQKIHTNLDNFVEYQRAKELLAAKATTAKTQTATGLGPEMGVVGLRINPLVGAGQIEALSDLNGSLGRRQISVLDIGGGLPANYASDRMDEALFAKMGFLASRIEWLKGSEEKPIVVSHFGADLCLRQAYTTQHPRRLEAYKADGSAFETEGEPESKRRKRCLVAGPLCFQGDVVSKERTRRRRTSGENNDHQIGNDALLPAELKEGDLLVMKDAGANTLSMHSRHCSRLAPPVYGYRTPNATSESVEFVEIKPRETMQQLYDFWGPLA
eukprot:g15138.t1